MAYDRSIFSSPAYWIALGAGVVGIGAAVMQERRGSASTRFTPDFFWSQIVPSAKRRAAEEKSSILVTFEERFNAWGMMSAAQQPRTRRTFAVIDAKGHVEHGPAWDASFDRGSAAVDPVKRYRDLQRMAAPSSGASDNERAMAKRLLAKMTPPPQQAPRATRSSGAGYGYAPPRRQAQPWQTDPRDSTEIYRNDLTDLNFAKKSIYEHASAPRVRVFLQGFDGTYLRSAFQAFSSLDDLGYAAEVLEAWGEPYFKRDGVFEAVTGRVEGEDQTRILRIRGRDVSGLGLVVQNEDFYDEERFSSFHDQLARHLAARVKAQAQKMR